MDIQNRLVVATGAGMVGENRLGVWEQQMQTNIYMCVCVQLSHFAVQQKLTQPCKSITVQRVCAAFTPASS